MASTVKGLNRLSLTAERAKLGQRLAALWNSRQSGGALTPGSDVSKIDAAVGVYVIDGLLVTSSAGNELTLPVGGTTQAAQYRKLLVAINQAGDYSFITGAVAASQAAAIKPAPGAGKCEVGYIEIPPSFTCATDEVTVEMLKQADPPAVALGPLP